MYVVHYPHLIGAWPVKTFPRIRGTYFVCPLFGFCLLANAPYLPRVGVCIDVIISESFAFFFSNTCIVFFMTRSSSFFLNVNFLMSNLISVVFKQVCLLINYLQVLIFLGFSLKHGCT